MNDNTELDLYIRSKKDRLIMKVKEHILNIEKELNITVDYSINENDNCVFIKGSETYSYFVSKWFHSNFLLNKNIVFKSHRNPFLSSNSRVSLLGLSLDENFEINKIMVGMTFQRLNYLYTSLNLTFNSNLLLTELDISKIKLNSNEPAEIIKKDIKSLCTYNDEILFFKLSHSSYDEIMELLPEYYIPSAYDFSSQDFIGRLSIFSMLTL